MNQIRIVENPDLQPITTTPAAAVLEGYVTQLLTGNVSQLLPQCSDLEGFEVGPGLITILGAYPGMGKTALTSQIMFDALTSVFSCACWTLSSRQRRPTVLVHTENTELPRLNTIIAIFVVFVTLSNRSKP